MNSQEIFDIPIATGTYDQFISKFISLSEKPQGSYVCLCNVHMMIEAQRQTKFKTILKEADIVTPDGVPITWALKMLNKINQVRVAGMDVLPDLLSELEKINTPVYFYGGTNEMLEKTNFYLKEKYPKLIVAGYYSPPFRNLTNNENDNIVLRINESGAKVIFIVLGCPKQEIWMSMMKEKIRGLMIGVGGAVPVMIGQNKRAPNWMQRFGLEWLYRLIQEPIRLFKRYTVTNAWFLFLLIKEYFKRKL